MISANGIITSAKIFAVIRSNFPFKRSLAFWSFSTIICEDEEVLYRIFLQAQRVWVIGKYYYAYRTKRGDSATGRIFTAPYPHRLWTIHFLFLRSLIHSLLLSSEVVKQFMDQKTGIPIRYFKQKHGGKHRAINYALGKAEGEYFFIVDSDDMLTDVIYTPYVQ